jgi:putative membrane protein
MTGFLLRLLVSALGLWIAAALVPGVEIRDTPTLFAAAFLLGFVNAVVRPVLLILTLPITIVTLGLFLLVINAALLGLVAALLPGFAVTSFAPALLAALVVSVTSWFASWHIGPSGRSEVIVVSRRPRP